MEYISGFPEFLQNVQQIQDQGDAERPSTRICKARSPSVSATRVLMPCGSRRCISCATSSMTAVLPLSKLAHTRWFSGRGAAGSSAGIWRIRNRLSTTCSGVRTQGARVNTVAILLRLAFMALGESHGGWCASAVRDFDAFYQERTPEPANGSILVAAQFFQAAFGHR